jgi:ribosome recycling factor
MAAMGSDEILMDTEERMEAGVTHLAGQLTGLRSGRASPALVDKLLVNAYETQTPLSQLAQIGCPEPRQILIKPYDVSILKNIEKAIQASNLGLNPSSDGKVLRLILPPLSEERRKQLVKVVKEHGEEALVALRNVRRDGNKHADTSLNGGGLTEDAHADLKDQIQSLLKTYEGKVNDLVAKKTAELMEV